MVYEYIVPRNPALAAIFAPRATRNSPVDCTRELFRPPKDAASLLDCNEKQFLVFVDDIQLRSEVGFWPFWPRLPGAGPTHKRKVFAQVIIGK